MHFWQSLAVVQMITPLLHSPLHSFPNWLQPVVPGLHEYSVQVPHFPEEWEVGELPHVLHTPLLDSSQKHVRGVPSFCHTQFPGVSPSPVPPWNASHADLYAATSSARCPDPTEGPACEYESQVV